MHMKDMHYIDIIALHAFRNAKQLDWETLKLLLLKDNQNPTLFVYVLQIIKLLQGRYC